MEPEPQQELDQWLTLKEARMVYPKSETWYRKLRIANRIKFIQRNRLVLYYKPDVERLAEEDRLRQK